MKDKAKEVEADLKEAYAPFIGERLVQGGALTYEMLCEAAERALEPYVHPCANGHLVSPLAFKRGWAHCSNCGTFLELTSK